MTHVPSLFDGLYWKFYREERLKIVLAHDPANRRPFQTALSPQEISHIARTARKRREVA